MTSSLHRTTFFAILLFASLAFTACDAPAPERADTGYILVLEYQYKFIPVEQLHLTPADACNSEHYHANGTVITLQGETLSEPDSKCGFGSDVELREVLMPYDYQGVQRTDKDWRYNPNGD
jgi:hypothetical protein